MTWINEIKRIWIGFWGEPAFAGSLHKEGILCVCTTMVLIYNEFQGVNLKVIRNLKNLSNWRKWGGNEGWEMGDEG